MCKIVGNSKWQSIKDILEIVLNYRRKCRRWRLNPVPILIGLRINSEMRIFMSMEKMTWVVKFYFIRGETDFWMHLRFSLINVQLNFILHQLNLDICSSFLLETISYRHVWFNLSKFTTCFSNHLFSSNLEITRKYNSGKLILPAVSFEIRMMFFYWIVRLHLFRGWRIIQHGQ